MSAEALERWRPADLAQVGAAFGESDGIAADAVTTLTRVGDGLWGWPAHWVGAAAIAADGAFADLTARVAAVSAGLGDIAALSNAAVSRLAAPLAALAAARAAVADAAASVWSQPFDPARALSRVALLRRAEGAVDAVYAADRAVADDLAAATESAHALLRRWNTGALRQLLAEEGVPPGVPAPGSPPDLVADWWVSRTPAERMRWLAADPAALGSLDGLPASVRDTANRLTMQTFLSSYDEARRALATDLVAAMETQDLGGLVAASARMRDLDRRHDFFGTVDHAVSEAQGEVQLVLADPVAFGDHGAAAIVFGDLDTASHVAFVVPGFRQRVVPELGRSVGNATALRAAGGGDSAGIATVAWLGYDVPMNVDVMSDGDARAGAGRLRAALRGLRASRRSGAQPQLTVVGHSYGSTTAGVMLRDYADTGVDDLVAIGSPGLGVDSAAQLHVPPGHVWVGSASGDLVDWLASFGTDPALDSFGARRFPAESLVHSATNPVEEHSHYFDRGGDSLTNIAAIATGSGSTVAGEPARFDVEQWSGPQRMEGAVRG